MKNAAHKKLQHLGLGAAALALIALVGVMIESNLVAGNQPIPQNLSLLRYGCSVTDACVDWATTEEMIRNTRDILREVLPQRSQA